MNGGGWIFLVQTMGSIDHTLDMNMHEAGEILSTSLWSVQPSARHYQHDDGHCNNKITWQCVSVQRCCRNISSHLCLVCQFWDKILFLLCGVMLIAACVADDDTCDLLPWRVLPCCAPLGEQLVTHLSMILRGKYVKM